MKKNACAASFLAMTAIAAAVGAEVPLGEAGFALPAPTAATQSADAVPTPENYGGAHLVAVNLSTWGMSPLMDGQWGHSGTGWSWHTAGGNSATCGNVHLPTGARLESITTVSDDTDAGSNITFALYQNDLATSTQTVLFGFTTTGTPGIQRILHTLPTPITISNNRRAQVLCVFHPITGQTLRSMGATLWYRLQVMPQPINATFPNDVPTTHPLHRFVEALAASGISAGCAAGSFCPDAPLTRGQMAVFLSTALGLHFPN